MADNHTAQETKLLALYAKTIALNKMSREVKRDTLLLEVQIEEEQLQTDNSSMMVEDTGTQPASPQYAPPDDEPEQPQSPAYAPPQFPHSPEYAPPHSPQSPAYALPQSPQSPDYAPSQSPQSPQSPAYPPPEDSGSGSEPEPKPESEKEPETETEPKPEPEKEPEPEPETEENDYSDAVCDPFSAAATAAATARAVEMSNKSKLIPKKKRPAAAEVPLVGLPSLIPKKAKGSEEIAGLPPAEPEFKHLLSNFSTLLSKDWVSTDHVDPEEPLVIDLPNYINSDVLNGEGNNSVLIRFTAPITSDRFCVNITGSAHSNFSDVLFHLNPRQNILKEWKGGECVVNDMQEGAWGKGVNPPLSHYPMMFGIDGCEMLIQMNAEVSERAFWEELLQT